jgi:acylphosphatase
MPSEPPDTGTVIRLRVLVSGRVQGVWFRHTCSERAHEAGVAGWVANRADGRVEAVFEGQRDAVEQMVAWCRHGPPRASVSGIEVHVEPVRGEPGFASR